MRPTILLAVLAAGLALVAGRAGLAPAPVDAQAKTVVWNLPHVAAPTYYHTVNLKALADRVRAKSGGRMEIRVHPASSLYPAPELIPAVVEGRAEIAPVLSAYLTDLMLEMGVLELPFMTGSIDEHRRVARTLRPFYEERMARHGLKLLTVHTWPSQQLFSNQPIRTLADWKGKKLRVYGAESADMVRALGGAPVSIPFGEVYTALQRGVVDGAVTSATNAEPMKFFEVSKFINYWYFSGASLEWLAVNRKAWDALPADLQTVVLEALTEVRFEDQEWEDAKAWDARARARARELGMTVVDPPQEEIEKARQQAREAWTTWARRTGEAGQRALELALKALGRSS
jgi:TRAP-type C4-dicarboxylate transport system substrate-binding protein